MLKQNRHLTKENDKNVTEWMETKGVKVGGKRSIQKQREKYVLEKNNSKVMYNQLVLS